ncbi:MAG: flagellar biosynthetic protein FliR [Desulfuromonadaceae bacterium]
MDALPLDITGFQLFLICLARMAAMFGTMPIFGSGMASARVRLGVILTLSLVIFPVVRPLLPSIELSLTALAILIASEGILGLLVGFTAQLIFASVELGGTIIGYMMGFAAANVYDPQSQRQVSVISQYQNVISILIFLSLDVHHLFIRAILHSYELLPPGGIDLGGEGIPFLLTLASNMFSLGVQFSAPILAVLLLSGLVLGILSRVFPQLNVFMLSFPLNIAVGFLVIGLTLSLMVTLLGREFHALEERILHLLQVL